MYQQEHHSNCIYSIFVLHHKKRKFEWVSMPYFNECLFYQNLFIFHIGISKIGISNIRIGCFKY